MNTLIDPQTLRSLREAKRWDRKALAQAAGIHPSVVSRLERGLQTDLKASILVALAHALDVPVNVLLTTHHQGSDIPQTPELAATLAEVSRLSDVHQRQVAAILRGYLSSLPDMKSPRATEPP